MNHLTTLADRVHYAWQCLPRPDGKEPPWRQLEEKNGLPNATFSRAINETVVKPSPPTLFGMAAALGTTTEWLYLGKGKAPTPQHDLPIRPRRSGVAHRDIDGWHEAVEKALSRPTPMASAAAFEAGAEMRVNEQLGFITEEIAVAAALYAWATASEEARKKYTLNVRRKTTPRRPPDGTRADHLRDSDRPKKR